MRHHRRINTDRGDGESAEVVVGLAGLLTESLNFTAGIFAFERGEIDHGDRQLQSKTLGVLLETPRAVFGDPFLKANIINWADVIKQSTNGNLNRGGHILRTIPLLSSENNAKTHRPDNSCRLLRPGGPPASASVLATRSTVSLG